MMLWGAFSICLLEIGVENVLKEENSNISASMWRIFEYIQIYSSEYWIFEYKYWHFYQQIYSDIQIIDLQYSNMWAFKHLYKWSLVHSLKLYLKQLWADYIVPRHSGSWFRESSNVFWTIYCRNLRKFNDLNEIFEYFQYSYTTKTQQTNIFVFIFVPKLTSRIYSYSYSLLNSIFITHWSQPRRLI